MVFALGPSAEARGYRLVSLETTGSTNGLARDAARSGEAGGLWVVAREQTAGRGRRGRIWHSSPGNLAASVLCVLEPSALRHAATLGFVAGVALADALHAVGVSGATLKWPNDVVLGGAKLAGILLECERGNDGRIEVVTGIGVNVADAPEKTADRVACIVSQAPHVTAESLFGALSDSWAFRFEEWGGGSGMTSIRTSWLERAEGIGKRVSVSSGGQVKAGRFETIDIDGRLVLRTAGGSVEFISAAEVHFGMAATARAG